MNELAHVRIEEVIVRDGRRPTRDIQSLADSISEIGLLNPIQITPNNELIAGRNRLEACRSLGWSDIPAFVRALSDLHQELAEIDENLIRNELTTLERGEQFSRRKAIYEALHPETKAYSSERQRQRRQEEPGEIISPGFTEDTAAKTGVTARTVQQEVQIAEKIAPEVKALIRDHDLANAKVELLELARIKDAEEQKAVAESVVSGRAASIKDAKKEIRRKEKETERARLAEEARAQSVPDDFGVLVGDFRDICKNLPDNSVDLIFTDPPYDRKTLPVYGDMAAAASRILRPGGSLICYLGQYLLGDVLALMTPHLRLWWCLACQHSGPCARMNEYGIVVKWKPMLWFVRSTRGDKETFVDDLILSVREKECHEWQQGITEAEYYIDKLTKPGDLVFDPFCGGGTTVVAARKLNRRWLTCDINEDTVSIARKRLHDAHSSR